MVQDFEISWLKVEVVQVLEIGLLKVKSVKSEDGQVKSVKSESGPGFGKWLADSESGQSF